MNYTSDFTFWVSYEAKRDPRMPGSDENATEATFMWWVSDESCEEAWVLLFLWWLQKGHGLCPKVSPSAAFATLCDLTYHTLLSHHSEQRRETAET